MRKPNSLRAPLRGDVVLGSLGSWKGRIASQRASGGASGAWIGQARERKGRSPVGRILPEVRRAAEVDCNTPTTLTIHQAMQDPANG